MTRACLIACFLALRRVGALIQQPSFHGLHFGTEFSEETFTRQTLKERSAWPPELSEAFDRYAEGARAIPFKAWLTGGYILIAFASSAMRMRGGGKMSAGAEPLKAQPLPSPAAPQQGCKQKAPDSTAHQLRARTEAALVLLAWMIMSPGFIIYNKWLFSKGGFPYPVTLTAMHMGSCFLVFGAISWLPRPIRSRIMPDVDLPISWEVYFKGFVPAALFMAMGLGFGNIGFLYASVVFIQLVKPVNVVITSLASFAWGLEVPTSTHMIIVTVVSGGVMLAAFGGVEFSTVGLICQLTASASEGLRLIILQGIMQTNIKLDPLTTIYRFAPLAGLMLCALSCAIEKPVDLEAIVSFRIVALNCIAAVILNIIIALVIARTSAVVSVLAGVTKDILTISVSSVIYASPVSTADCVGYGLSLSGILMYKVYKDNLKSFVEAGFLGGWKRVLYGEPPPKNQHS